jgi:FkbM family methyltransferase
MPQGYSLSIGLDYLTRPARRGIRASGERGTIEWDGRKEQVTLCVAGENPREFKSLQTRQEQFLEQARAWMAAREGEVDPRLCLGFDAARSVAVCDAARRLSQAHREEGSGSSGPQSFLRTVRSALLFLATAPSIRIPLSIRNRFLSSVGYLLRALGVRQIPVMVNGVKLYVDPTGSWTWKNYILSWGYSFREICAVKDLIPKEYVFVDVGAHCGAWAFPLAKHFSQVIAVEPDPRCYRLCLLTAKALQAPNVLLENAALSDCDREGTLFMSHALTDSRIYAVNGSHGKKERIRLRSFDSLISQWGIPAKRFFIKLDVQGAEPWVLEGMRETLASAEDVILWTEATEETLLSAGSSLDQYLGLLERLGFVPVSFSDHLKPMDWKDVRVLLRSVKDHGFRFTRND